MEPSDVVQRDGAKVADGDHRAVPADDAPGRQRRRSRWRYVLVPVLAAFAAFWIWALFFASKESVNKIGDRAWAARAEAICGRAGDERAELADYRRLDGDDPAMLAERADVIDRATDIVEGMLDDVVAVAPADPKGQAIVPKWEDDFRRYLGNRRAYTERLRAGQDAPFAQEAVDGIPITERVEAFAADNEMPSCAPPHDL